MGIIQKIFTTPLGLYVELFGIVMLVNAIGARADARVWAAMRRVEQAKMEAQERKRAEAAQRILDTGDETKDVPKLTEKAGNSGGGGDGGKAPKEQ